MNNTNSSSDNPFKNSNSENDSSEKNHAENHSATPAILHGLRIIELSTSPAAALATQLLAEMGADVIRLDIDTAPDSADGFAVWDRSKRGLYLNPASERERLEQLLRHSQVLVHDLNPDQARALGLDDAALAHRHPHLLSTAITAYPAGHSLQNLPSNDALVLAASGAMHLQPAINRPGPTYIRFPLATQTAAYLGAIGIVAKLLPAQQADTLPQAPGSVKTSLLQGVMTTLLMLQHRASQPTESLAGLPKTIESQIFQCADGLWLHLQSSPEQAPLFAAELARYSTGQLQHALTSNPWYMAFLPRFGLYADIIRRHPRQHWLDDLWASDVAVEAVEPVGKLFRDAQVQHNGYSVSVDDARHGPLLQPFSPLHIDPPPRIAHPAPTPGQHSASLLQELEQWLAQTDTPPRATQPGTGAQPQPLAGLKVLDFGNYLAGPLAPMLMADLGATVIKVEAKSGDMLRWAEWAFVGAQRGKRSLALDLKNPAAQPVLARLIEWADVVHHNLRMPAATKLGLDYTALRAINPQLVYCHVSAYGPSGPRCDWPGYDQMMQSSSGWEIESAGTGNPPQWLRFGMTDHLCALGSLLATLLAVYHQRRQGGAGQAVSTSLLGATLMSLSEFRVAPDGSVAPYPRLDQQQLGVAPWQRLYACADGWICVSGTAATFADLLQHSGTATPEQLEQQLAQRPRASALDLCASAGLNAVRVRPADQLLLDDPELQALGLLARYPHSQYGVLEQMGALWIFDHTPPPLDRAPPTLGQHSREILGEAGFSNAAIDTLLAQGVVVETDKVVLK